MDVAGAELQHGAADLPPDGGLQPDDGLQPDPDPVPPTPLPIVRSLLTSSP